jgi:hypothetical protein
MISSSSRACVGIRTLPWSRSVGWATRAALLLALLLSVAGSARAQSIFGTVRGTVFDAQRNVVPGASVVVTDEATNVARDAVTDSAGNFEVPNLRPGSYSVEVSLAGFKKVKRSGLLLRAASVALADIQLEVGGVDEVVQVTAEGQNNITLESPSISRGLDEQQIRDLPRNSRDIQDFLTLNPNVVGGFDSIQFLGGRTYGVSYVQDGQLSVAGIFGEVSNSAPGLDAISEMQVLSNSYSAEYGGLAGVVVSTKRGANQFHGSGFYDFNSNALNALTYGETLNGVTRDDPNADTHEHRYGVSLGGPIIKDRTFFFANYEGSRLKQLGGGARAIVPTTAMRAGDFSGASFTLTDPETGLPFPNNVIPADRIDPAARKIIDMFYPLPNQDALSNGYGAYRQIVPLDRNRDRTDLRVDHELTKNDSLFSRFSWQNRDPDAFTFEQTGSNGGTGLVNSGILDRSSKAITWANGWTRVLSSTMVNELRGGYSSTTANRRSHFIAGQVGQSLGIDVPALAQDAPGFPTFLFSGANRPSDIRDQRQNTFRDVDQSAISISNNLTWLKGQHSLKVGGLYSHNLAKDGYSTGANESKGRYTFSGFATGNALGDFLLRYEVTGLFVDKNNIYANFVTDDGGHHVVPNASIAELLPPGAVSLDRTLTADAVGVGPALMHTDRNNFSPRLGFAYRLDQSNKTVVRGGFGIFHPTGAAQGARDIMSRNPFRYSIRHNKPTLEHGFTTGTVSTAQDFANQGLDLNLESPDIYQYNVTLERELPGDLGLRVSYIGSTMRKLLVNRDLNTVPASDVPLGDVGEDPEAHARLPYPIYNTFMDITSNGGSGQFNALQLEVVRRFRHGFAIDAAYTLAHSDSNAPDSGNSTIGVVQYDPYNIELDRGPDPNVVRHRFVFNSTWMLPFGRGQAYGADMPRWADALVGGWTIATIMQARSGQYLTPFFTYGTDPIFPANTGRALDGVGLFGEAWRPDVNGDPNVGGSREQFFNPAVYSVPAPGTLGNAKKGSLLGPGTWVVNFAFYKDIIKASNYTVEFTALMDNAFNHPQFYVPDLGTDGFADLTDLLINDTPDNGTTGVLGADTVGNVEGFSPGRAIRFGLRMRF